MDKEIIAIAVGVFSLVLGFFKYKQLKVDKILDEDKYRNKKHNVISLFSTGIMLVVMGLYLYMN